jgi:hypothetical protein
MRDHSPRHPYAAQGLQTSFVGTSCKRSRKRASMRQGINWKIAMAEEFEVLLDALIDVGADPVRAAKAAAEVADHWNRLASIRRHLTILKWMVGAQLLLTLAAFFEVFMG